MTAIVLRGDARSLPLPDGCVDLIVTSPPYFGLRSYTDGGTHYGGQIGSEATPADYITALLECTAEWMRVLKPSGSIFVNLADKYAMNGTPGGNKELPHGTAKDSRRAYPTMRAGEFRPKSLLGLPWRYALAATDQLGLILRRDIIWSKPNGLPESVTDRCRSSHEYVFHLVKQPRYYAAVDEIREPHLFPFQSRTKGRSMNGGKSSGKPGDDPDLNPLGKLPGSVWEIPEGEPVVRVVLRALIAGAITVEEAERLLTPEPQDDSDAMPTVWSIPSAPLTVPAHLGVDHFAAFPPELPRRIILGWSPPGICTACGEGRRPVSDKRVNSSQRTTENRSSMSRGTATIRGVSRKDLEVIPRGYDVAITGYACACTPHTDHDGSGRATQRRDYSPGHRDNNAQGTYGRHQAGEYEPVGPWREYHFDAWTPPPTRPALVLDPFGGTGTTALVAAAYGRLGVTIDRSADYSRLAQWRVNDPAERARAMHLPKPPPIPPGQASLFDEEVIA